MFRVVHRPVPYLGHLAIAAVDSRLNLQRLLGPVANQCVVSRHDRGKDISANRITGGDPGGPTCRLKGHGDAGGRFSALVQDRADQVCSGSKRGKKDDRRGERDPRRHNTRPFAFARGIQVGLAPEARVRSSTVIAEATTLATSARLVGMIIVLLVFARLPSAVMYSSAILRFAACCPPSFPSASATAVTAAAVASATTRSAVASPCALLIADCFSPSDLRIAACFSPSARLISCCFSPSDLAMRARFSRSAVICACIARRMVSGGVRFFTS